MKKNIETSKKFTKIRKILYHTLSMIFFRIIFFDVIFFHVIFLFKISHCKLMNMFTINTSNCIITIVITNFFRLFVIKMFISLLVNKYFFRFCWMFFIQWLSILTNRFYNFRVNRESKFFFIYLLSYETFKTHHDSKILEIFEWSSVKRKSQKNSL